MIAVAKIHSKDCETDTEPDVPMIEFVSPMPGFPDLTRFVLVRVTEEGVLYALTSVDDPNLRFLVVPRRSSPTTRRRSTSSRWPRWARPRPTWRTSWCSWW